MLFHLWNPNLYGVIQEQDVCLKLNVEGSFRESEAIRLNALMRMFSSRDVTNVEALVGKVVRIVTKVDDSFEREDIVGFGYPIQNKFFFLTGHIYYYPKQELNNVYRELCYKEA